MEDDSFGPVAFKSSSQASFWIFDEARLAELRREAHALAVTDWPDLEKQRLGEGEARPRSRCLPVRGSGAAAAVAPAKKRPREEEGGAEGPATPLLTAEEELIVVDRFRKVLLEKWAAGFPQLAQNEAIGATAALLFSRFYVSNSVMAFDPQLVGLAALMVASKGEGTWGFLPALEIGDAALPRDESFQTKVPLKARDGREGFALVGCGATPEGGFCPISEPDEATAETTRARVLAFEMALLDGTGFHLFVHHPFAPLRGFANALKRGLGCPGAQALAPPPPPTSAEIVPPAPTSRPVATVSLSADEAVDQLVSLARKLLARSLASDAPLLWPPSHLALAALTAAADDCEDKRVLAALGLATGAFPGDEILARVAVVAPESNRQGVAASVGAAKARLKNLAASKSKGKAAKEAMAKLFACAAWRS